MGGTDSMAVASRLKSENGWENSNWGAGIDACGFSVLPAGEFSYESSGEGNSAVFLSATAIYETGNYLVALDRKIGYFYSGGGYYTIRCIRD
jgi:uncharacterized protein (TIGR02145 family)